VTLAAGTRLGPYEIVAPLGAGGMGEVYRARDAKLQREVAIKVLPSAFASDAERLARFRREAQVLAALNHPHIAAIYGLEESAGVEALVLELVEGETLAERIARGAIPLEEALPIAREMAWALEAAHEKGIVHRDLKPANVKLTPGGKVKVLDFGLAKALTGDPSSPDATSSPTLTARSTEAGVVIGTAAYMSPEQARGRAVDRRSDIWAFGTVLYEMLAGRRAFEGETASDALAAVLTKEPDWKALPKETPPPIRRLLRRCLDRDRERRLHDVADARLEIDEALSGTAPPEAAAAIASPRARPSRAIVVAAVLVAAAAASLATLWIAGRLRPPAPSAPVVRPLTDSGRDWSPAASPDGRFVAFVSDRDGRPRIWLKQLPGGDEAALTAGPDDQPHFFPDGSSVLFVRNETHGPSLFRVSVLGGEPRRVVADAYDGAWSPDGSRIAFMRQIQDGGQRIWVLYSASSDGSDAKEIFRTSASLIDSPVWSPDGEEIVCYPRMIGSSTTNIPMYVVKASGGGHQEVGVEGTQLRSPAVWNGRGRDLLFARAAGVAGLDASPVDVRRLDLGSKRETQVFWSPNRIMALDILGPGKLVFDVNSSRYNLQETALGGGRAAGWLTRGPGLNRQPRYSPDGKSILFSALKGGNLDVWSLELANGALRRLTDSPAADFDPALTPDGKELIWSSDRGGHFEIWMANADGTGARQVSHDGNDAENATGTPDGQWIAYVSGNPKSFGIWKVRTDGTNATLLTSGLVDWPEVSPDGRYVAYLSARFTPQRAIRVLRFEDGSHVPFTIPLGPSARGFEIVGRMRWMPDGRSLAFLALDGQRRYGVYVQDFVPDKDTSATRRQLAGFDPEFASETFAISPDGGRICIAQWEQVTSIMAAEGVPGVEPPARKAPAR
jgi:Tol biopolymer transport system component